MPQYYDYYPVALERALLQHQYNIQQREHYEREQKRMRWEEEAAAEQHQRFLRSRKQKQLNDRAKVYAMLSHLHLLPGCGAIDDMQVPPPSKRRPVSCIWQENKRSDDGKVEVEVDDISPALPVEKLELQTQSLPLSVTPPLLHPDADETMSEGCQSSTEEQESEDEEMNTLTSVVKEDYNRPSEDKLTENSKKDDEDSTYASDQEELSEPPPQITKLSTSDQKETSDPSPQVKEFAASTIQRVYRHYRSYSQIQSLYKHYQNLITTQLNPALKAAKLGEDRFNTRTKPFYLLREELEQVLEKLDGVVSWGNKLVREERRKVVSKVQDTLTHLEEERRKGGVEMQIREEDLALKA